MALVAVLVLSACGQAARAPSASTSASIASASATATATPASLNQITVSGAISGTFQNPVSACNQTYPITNTQTTTKVSARGELAGHPAEIDILDPAGPADYESQGHALFYFHQSADSTYGWTSDDTAKSPSAAITSFDSKTGATFSVTLGLNQQFSSAAQPFGSDSPLTVAGTIACG